MALNSSSVIFPNDLYGIQGVSLVRNALRKSASDQVRMLPPGVRSGAQGEPGAADLPPDSMAPWHDAQSLVFTRYSPYSAVTPDEGADGREPL